MPPWLLPLATSLTGGGITYAGLWLWRRVWGGIDQRSDDLADRVCRLEEENKELREDLADLDKETPSYRELTSLHDDVREIRGMLARALSPQLPPGS